MMVHLLIELRFNLSTAFHSTGNFRRWGVDKALARDAEGRQVIPATTVKGFLRERAEILLRAWGHAVCLGPEPANMCDGRTPCLVCQVFGNPRFPSPLHFADGVPLIEVSTTVRSGVAISRHRRAAYPQRLFFIETTEPMPTRWQAQCEGDFPDKNEAQKAAALIAMAARWGTAIGGGKTRGLGWIKDVRVKAVLNGAEIPEQDLVPIWQAWKEGKNVAEN
ncbi:RAMP superfamily CRISPR-associated protein [uncultured Chloroflexus sp.]|uniref:RAMP superfamily CRISPR-associated protein n=1 Tax=uncultured Chloroflexus sp. TaxID=214040 RepID=UPI0026040C5E|nr:RAMP superfamily CRISPR-associated protein [uncultured Chloroflexus sp.]